MVAVAVAVAAVRPRRWPLSLLTIYYPIVPQLPCRAFIASPFNGIVVRFWIYNEKKGLQYYFQLLTISTQRTSQANRRFVSFVNFWSGGVCASDHLLHSVPKASNVREKIFIVAAMNLLFHGYWNKREKLPGNNRSMQMIFKRFFRLISNMKTRLCVMMARRQQ